MEWLSANHPETFADKFSGNDGIGSVALSDLFGDVPVASPVAELVSDCTADSTTKISAENTRNKLFDDMGIDLAQGDPSDKEGHGSADKNDNDSAGKAKNSKRDFEQRPDVAGNIEQPHNKLRCISKYLVQFVPDAKPQTSETPVRISGARVLTGEKCIAILKEHEEKQKQQQEDKEQKKAEREQWKMAKEEEQKKKESTSCGEEGISC